MIILSLIVLILIIMKYGNPFGNLSIGNRKVWNRMGLIFAGTLVIIIAGIAIRHR